MAAKAFDSGNTTPSQSRVLTTQVTDCAGLLRQYPYVQLRKKGRDCLALGSGHLSLDNDAPLPCPLAPILKPRRIREQIINFVQGASPPTHTHYPQQPPPLPFPPNTHTLVFPRERNICPRRIREQVVSLFRSPLLDVTRVSRRWRLEGGRDMHGKTKGGA